MHLHHFARCSPFLTKILDSAGCRHLGQQMHPGKEVRPTALKLGDISERKEPGTQRSKKENVTLWHLRDPPLGLTLDPPPLSM